MIEDYRCPQCGVRVWGDEDPRHKCPPRGPKKKGDET